MWYLKEFQLFKISQIDVFNIVYLEQPLALIKELFISFKDVGKHKKNVVMSPGVTYSKTF